jgi:hypothetical protein
MACFQKIKVGTLFTFLELGVYSPLIFSNNLFSLENGHLNYVVAHKEQEDELFFEEEEEEEVKE